MKVDLRTTVKTNQYKYHTWTFNDSVPGPFIWARVGDIVELSLTNRDETGNPHNIDCHAFEGPGVLTTSDENQTKTARFCLLYPDLFIYHCAAAPVPVHIANGMYIQAEWDWNKISIRCFFRLFGKYKFFPFLFRTWIKSLI